MPAHMDSSTATTVLVAEDESVVLKAMSMTLANIGYHVLQSRHGDEAHAVLEKHRGQSLHLLITDVDMPGGGGQALAKYARAHFSGVKVLYTSGNPRCGFRDSLKSEADFRFLEKPFAPQDLMKSLGALLAE